MRTETARFQSLRAKSASWPQRVFFQRPRRHARFIHSFQGDRPTMVVQEFSEQLLEQVFDSFSSALEYFASAINGADSDVLAGVYRTFAQVSGCIDGMKCYQVGGGFPGSLGCAARAFRRTFADVSRARSHVPLGGGVGLGVRA